MGPAESVDQELAGTVFADERLGKRFRSLLEQLSRRHQRPHPAHQDQCPQLPQLHLVPHRHSFPLRWP